MLVSGEIRLMLFAQIIMEQILARKAHAGRAMIHSLDLRPNISHAVQFMETICKREVSHVWFWLQIYTVQILSYCSF